MIASNETAVEFRCPGEVGPISRAVHLARLAAVFWKCRECPHRADTGLFSRRRAKQIAEVFAPGPCPALPEDEGIAGVLLDELTPAVARRAGVAFGLLLRDSPREKRGRESLFANDCCEPKDLWRTKTPDPFSPETAKGHLESEWPTVLLAGDGRRLTSPLVAAAAEGLRFAGCHVIDMGQATSGCLAFALQRSGTDAGMLVGNPGHRAHQAGLSFWVGGRPLARGEAGRSTTERHNPGHRCAMAQAPSAMAQAPSAVAQAPTFERFEAMLNGSLDRPAREFGALERASFEADYLASLAEWYHGVRPLVVVLETPCGPLVDYVRQLSASLECRFLEDRSRLAESQVVERKAHFAMRIDGNGETSCVLDERGQLVSAGRLLRLIAQRLIAERADGPERGATHPSTIVVEEDGAAEMEDALRGLGARVVRAGSRRAAMCRAMEDERALVGGGPSGRFWYARSGHVSPDALVTLSLLLTILSQSDRPLSRVLDETAGPG